MMNSIKALVISLSCILSAGQVYAQDASAYRNTFYIGGGNAKADGPFENDDTPLSIGFMHQLENRKLILGADIGREGTMLDSTWNMNEQVKQATSYNFLIGANLVEKSHFRADAALLIGVRESAADCAGSFLGFQCYADTEPDTDYKGNFGGVITLSYDRMTLGLRATGESTQILAGLRF